MEEYPEYRFIQSQPAAYEMCRQYDPELFERIREAVKGGQWIAEGAMWVEPDTNMAGGEALIRQLMYGKKYYKEVFDVDSEILWLPDTFGYTAALPQILKGCGVKYLVTQKIFWSYNEGEEFPYHYFNWEGMDGTRIVSFLPTNYTYRTDPTEANKTWKTRRQIRDLEAFLMPYGYGDGGGGPARDYVEYAIRQRDLEGSVKMKMTGPGEFFRDMEEQGGPVHNYVGELYFSAHRGTYTAQAMVKQNNRRSELALREMEFWTSIALGKGWDGDTVRERSRAEALWKQLLLQQFHDILPGSSIGRVYEEAEKAHEEVQAGAGEVTEEVLGRLAGSDRDRAVTVWNSFSFERTVLVRLPEAFGAGVRTLEGEPIPWERTDACVKALVMLPACGAVSLVPLEEKNQDKTGTDNHTGDLQVTVSRIPEGFAMENRHVRALINREGEVVSFRLKCSGREFAAGAMNHFLFYKDVPRKFDAWDIDSNYIDQEIQGLREAKVEEVSQGLEGVLMLTGRIGSSQMAQYIRLAAEGRRLEFDTEICWKELHGLLKVSFPAEVYGENGINEMQFGYVERPAHRSKAYDKDRFEVCNHRYSALCDGAHGAAVLNDCKYGISMNGNALELTLLRGSAAPEMRADNREHRFTYAFTAWEGSFSDCDVVRQGYELNGKPPVTSGAVSRFSALEIDRGNVILDAMKPAEDGSGDIILRLYESKKAAVTARLTFGSGLGRSPVKAYLCDMLENIQEEIPVQDGKVTIPFRAFEVKTVRIR